MEALSFDDVLLVPQRSAVWSRSDIDLESYVTKEIEVKFPIISANMPSVTGPIMAQRIWELGGFGILHRFNSISEAVADYTAVKLQDAEAGVSLGVGEETSLRVKQLFKYGARIFCIDVAHGHHDRVITLIHDLRNTYGNDIEIIAGNVATDTACFDLAEAGADAIKIGIGPGAACTTREVTGFGIPQVSAISNCATVKGDFPDLRLIADGGIKNSGDIVKALVFGADTVMLGRLLAGAEETPYPGEYFGNASARLRDYHAPEGISGVVDIEGPLENIIKNLTWGIKSGLSYAGATTIFDLHANAIEFVITTPQSTNETRTRI